MGILQQMVFSPFTLLFGKRKEGPGLMSTLLPYALNYLLRDKTPGASFQNNWQIKLNFSEGNRGLVLDGHKYRLNPQDSFTHLAVISPSGAGKTSRYIIPNIFHLTDSSLVITDYGGELYRQTSGYLQRQGYALQVLNLKDPSQSLRYNPLARVQSHKDMAAIAHVLVRSAFPQDYEKNALWYGGAETIITVLISALRRMKKPELLHLPNVLRLLQNMGRTKDFEEFLDQYASKTTWNQYMQLVTGNQKMMSSFQAIASTALNFLNDPALARLFADDGIDFGQLRREKTALFLIIPPGEASLYSVVLNLVYTELFKELMRDVPGKQDKSVYVLGDEWGHTAVPNFAMIATTIRQYRVSLSIVLQSVSQLNTNYGHDAARTILEGGMVSKLFYGGLDIESAHRAEQMCGRRKVGSILDKGPSREENLMNADRIRTMGKHEALFISGNKEPVLFRDTAYCFEHGRMKRYMEYPPVPLPQASRQRVLYIDL